ncbi:MAG TPA: hypothetical protein PLV42_09635 [bacterium]|nr:hypothetical protein [bacterium]
MKRFSTILISLVFLAACTSPTTKNDTDTVKPDGDMPVLSSTDAKIIREVINDDDTVTLSSADTQKINEVVKEARKAILNKDTEALLKNISATKGLTCTDTLYTYKEIKKFLRDKNSHLYISLFDTVRYSKRFSKECRGFSSEYAIIADIDFLQSANESIKITPFGNDWVEVIIESPIKTHWPLSWALHREGPTWKIAGSSFIIGSCSCG